MSEQAGLELRILSGLHRGASLPLGEQHYVIGASDDADVVLLDPGMVERHAALHLTAAGWLLSAEEGELRGAASDALLTEQAMQAGDCLRLGGVWIGLAAAGAAWTEPPPLPPATAGVPDKGHEADAATPGDGADDGPEWAAQEPDAMPPPVAEVEAGGDAPSAAPAAPAAARKRPRSRAMLLPALAGTALAGVATLAISAKTPPAPPPPPIVAIAPPAPPTPAALAQALRKRLADVDMLRRLDLQLNDGAWRIKAALDEDEALRLRRILAEFVKANNIGFPIDVELGGADTMLPFQIRQIVTGNQASIVTMDGQRIYPGDEHRGVRLTAIDGNRLSFAGRQPIEVKW
ncbi:FHA domain-containing protein [Pseudoduganella violacea]|uniref:Type III secretion protein D n=1 Tax=Pseudoduganella violacea TaxID=1715466 RepID=A0A7W5BFI8_9BURK|nr:FHA domain-containing protein [Pseudoduganella violacea]MBB3121945.1 type III secretion protein D [Pseudoduganella violacea]